MDTKEVTQEVRLRQWAQIIRERQASGMVVNAFCEMHGIKRHQYFYWQRKLREMACVQMEMANTAPFEKRLVTPGFAQVRVAEKAASHEWKEPAGTGHLRIEIGGLAVIADRDYPPEKLAALLQELGRIC